jgi:septal ring factor EnvC (AmiA/AmiB activator)
MQSRHRVPTVFTLYMVDVLCCALGCVIFLWFLKIHEARNQEQVAEQREKESALVSSRLAQTRTDLDAVTRQRQAVRQQLAAAEKERDRVKQDYAAARARAADLDREVAALKGRLATADLDRDKLAAALADVKTKRSAVEERLTKTTRERADLTKDLATARERVQGLEKLLRDKEEAARLAARTADELAERLRDENARIKLLEKQADLVPGLRAENEAYRDKLASLGTRAQGLEKELGNRKKQLAGAGHDLETLKEANRKLSAQLAEAERGLQGLRGDKQTLVQQVSREKAARENRFAGIELTGRRVIFLVDMSGSMELVDERTEAPAKWRGVRESLAKIMRSLPDLEKFHVIVFSDKVDYLLGHNDRWLDFNPKTSVDEVVQALEKIKPNGSTDMYSGFQAAFRFRQAGMDTIYLFSDGLPNVGPALTEEQSRNLTEQQRGEILGRQIRRVLADDWNAATNGRPRVRINSVGFFFESPDVGAFLWALSRENNGSFVGMSKP